MRFHYFESYINEYRLNVFVLNLKKLLFFVNIIVLNTIMIRRLAFSLRFGFAKVPPEVNPELGKLA